MKHVLILLLGIAIVTGCSSATKVSKPTEYELRKKSFSEARTFNLVVSGSPWPTFETVASDIVAGFGYLPASAGTADLNIAITLSGEPFGKSFNLHKTDRMGRLHNTYETQELDVGYVVKGSVEIGSESGPPESYKLFGAEYGPDTLRSGSARLAVADSKAEVLRALVGNLCENLLWAFPDRVPIGLIENGADEDRRQACLERMTFDRSKNLRRVIEALLLLDSKPQLTGRAIGAIRQQDQYDFHSRFPAWLASPEPSIQLAAARKLVELNTNVSRSNTQKSMYKKEGLHYMDRVDWLLDSINDVDPEAKPIVAQTALLSVLPEIQSTVPGSDEWQDWCGLQGRIDALRVLLADDPNPKVRDVVAATSSTFEAACSLDGIYQEP